ncbi:AIPR family protein [Cognatilysobacter lacus]|uniref:AIPR family protein n=1 Tax=Cognatilysobacter lacus TaxID=1643323 RepID=A0A5D8Z4E2_9GAMM|nr:AIPR family protein [Lysobacter lacus]TZF89631.1 AIPR family protein [Lysobacter lacus]
MATAKPTWQGALDARDDLGQYGDNAIGLFALALRFSVDDIHSVAAESVTDGSDDKKCDLIYIDRDEGVAVVAQCYCSSKQKQGAPANKASDLNTAVAWLMQRPIKELPKRLRSAAKELRSAISDGSIKRFEAWYVHNLPETQNVQDELATVTQTAKSVIAALHSASKVEISSLEIGNARLDDWYQETLSPILVNDEIKIEVESGFTIDTANWKSYVTAIPARVLHRLYKSHGTQLFSANVRDYLGSRKSDANINNGIKQTVQTAPENFWVFNNGITILTHSFAEGATKNKKTLTLRGISIVNGAQTTGAIGTLPKAPSGGLVPARVVSTADNDLVYDIIQYNNSQNKVTASDFRSTDRVQKRLRDEVEAIPNAKYEGGRRGGHKDAIQRNKNLMPSYTVGQALAAFHQDPIVAYNSKSDIWVNDQTYARFFNDDTTGAHLVFCYSLLRSVEDAKRSLVAKSKSKELTAQEETLLEYFRQRGSTYLLVSAMAACVETFVGKRIGTNAKVSFGPKTSPTQAGQHWSELVTIVSPFCQQLSDALSDGLKSNERAQKAIGVFRSLVQATASANAESYKRFGKGVTVSR